MLCKKNSHHVLENVGVISEAVGDEKLPQIKPPSVDPIQWNEIVSSASRTPHRIVVVVDQAECRL